MDNKDKQNKRTRRLLVDFPRAVPVAIFLLVLAVTALSVWAIERADRARQEASLMEQARAVSSALERRSDASDSYLRAGAALFGTVDVVSDNLFRRFVNELRLDSDYRGADGIGWAVVLSPGDRVDAALPENVELYPTAPEDFEGREFIVPVTYLQPDTVRNRRALGYDMYSEPVRRAAMDQARSSVRPTASGPLVLVQEGDGSAPGFIIYMPVFRGTGDGRDLKGYIYSPFNAESFLTAAVPPAAAERMNVTLHAGKRGDQGLLAEIQAGEGSQLQVTEPVRIANNDFLLRLEAAGAGSLSLLSMMTMLFGLAVASLLLVVARLLTQQALEDQASLEWLEEQNAIRDSLTRELNHRVKNTLANVLSIISLTRRRSSDLDEFADGLDGRVRALSATHDLLTQSEWGTTPIRAVVEAELAPYAHGNDRAVTMNGPDVELSPNDALSLGLAIHELATNAAKYGALSVAEGRVDVEWERVDDRLARLSWREMNGPPVAEQRQRGFGSDLIEKIVAHELRHPVDLRFERAGVSCVLLVPIRELSEFALRARLRNRENELSN